VAEYDYDSDAADTDEVSFVAGDVFVDVDPVDGDWYVGTVARTGASGSIPANYVALQ
jgi:hypothetical protein